MSSLKQLIPTPIDRFLRRRINAYREKTASERALPDFIIIGAQKSGTTSLFEYLAMHPQLVPSIKKEVHFFDEHYDLYQRSPKNGENWYRSMFPLRKKLKPDKLTFEASPYYCFHPQVAGRIFQLLPDVKLIMILRDPVERAISHYFHSVRKGRETLPIMDALTSEEDRLHEFVQSGDYSAKPMHYYSYKMRGHYREQIDRYLNYFPESQLLLIQSEKFFSDIVGTLREIFRFVGVDPGFTPVKVSLTRKNKSKNRVPLDQKVYNYMREYFQLHNDRLFDLPFCNFRWD